MTCLEVARGALPVQDQRGESNNRTEKRQSPVSADNPVNYTREPGVPRVVQLPPPIRYAIVILNRHRVSPDTSVYCKTTQTLGISSV